jgi:hypothetical protein
MHWLAVGLNIATLFFSGISNANVARLHSIQNSLARVVTHKLKYEHITPSLKSLH